MVRPFILPSLIALVALGALGCDSSRDAELRGKVTESLNKHEVIVQKGGHVGSVVFEKPTREGTLKEWPFEAEILDVQQRKIGVIRGRWAEGQASSLLFTDEPKWY